MSSNNILQTTVVVLVIAHAGILTGVWFSPRGVNFLLCLNAIIAIAILGYAASRIRYILAPLDWPYLGLIAFELLVLTVATWAFRGNQIARICSYCAFGLHGLASIVAVGYAFFLKFNRLF